MTKVNTTKSRNNQKIRMKSLMTYPKLSTSQL